jgi:uncharacterized OB-fold protein
MRDHKHNCDRDKIGRESKRETRRIKLDRHTCPMCGGVMYKDEQVCTECAGE